MTKDTRVDSGGKGPEYHPGDVVWVAAVSMQATVIQQNLSYDYPDDFWGNVQLMYEDGITGTSNSWQLSRVIK